MSNPITIICGTNRPDAVSKAVSILYQRILNDLDAPSEIVYLENLPQDFAFTALYDNSGRNAGFNPFREKMEHTNKQVSLVDVTLRYVALRCVTLRYLLYFTFCLYFFKHVYT